MESILSWGVELIRAVQRHASPALTIAMKGLTALGSEWFYLAVLPVVYWCVDRRKGQRLGVVFLASAFLNLWLKDLFAQPRPYDLDPSVGMARESSHGLPSGHSQNSAVFWGLAAPQIRRPWGLVLALALPLLIGFSRIYLGVHFPTDVFAGWALGGIFLGAYALAGHRAERALDRLDVRAKVALVAGLAFAMNALEMRDTSIAGGFFGMGIGLVYAGRLAPFSAGGPLGKRALRFVFGMAGAAVLYLGLKAVFPGKGSELYALFRFLRYGLLGAWVALGAPWAFLRLKLAEREDLSARG